MNDVKNVLLVGVGGQGTILASKILSEGLIQAGYDVKMSEVHGMSQRGGSVSTQIRYGKKVFSPIIGKGQADILVSFETMETARWVNFIKPTAKIVSNDYKIPPMPVLSGEAEYPASTVPDISAEADILNINAGKIADELGNGKTMNIVLLGALIKAMKLDYIDWHAIISGQVKPAFAEINKEAFDAGMALVSTTGAK